MLSSIGNYYEHLVMERIAQAQNQNASELATAEIEDLACVALNYLPPRYVRHAVDLAAHLSDAEHRSMREEVADAVDFALLTTRRRQEVREADRDA